MRNIRRWIDEDMPVIERSYQLELARQQHAIAEYVTRHIAYAYHRNRRGIEVMTDLVEVPLDRFPCAFRGNAEFFMVIPVRTAGRERIAQPEAALDRDAV